MTNGNGVVEEAIADMQELLAETRQRDRTHTYDFPASSPERPLDDRVIDLLLPQQLDDNILLEVPSTDPTYTAIDGTLLESKSSTGIKLCQFRTFQGALALQPCISNRRQLDLFDGLNESEATGHRVYKGARLWSCIVQAIPNLPVQCRWLAATVFNFASEMLRPDTTQGEMWVMRTWLYHWYSVAGILFRELHVDREYPIPDWFQSAAGIGAELALIQEGSNDDSNSSDGTVVHHVLSPEAPEFIRGSVLHPIAQVVGPDADQSLFITSSISN